MQLKLDAFVSLKNCSRIRKQKKTHLPSGGSPDEFWTYPEDHHLENQLIPVPDSVLDELIEEHTPADLFAWVDDAEVEARFEEAYAGLGSPALTLQNTWDVFLHMLLSLE